MTAHHCFSIIFDDSGYNFVLNGTFNAVDWEGLGGGETRLEMFKRALERYKAEFKILGNTIHIENLIGRDTQFQYRYRLNASNIVQENDATAMWTYAIGYGDYEDAEDGGWENANLVREYTSPLASVIGIRHAPPIKDGRITSQSTMDNQLKTLVDESLKISVSADIHDLRRQGYPLAQPELGDRVFLIDERIGLDEEVRVVDISITRNWRGEVIDLKLTFGSESITKRYQSNLQTAIKDIQGVMSGNKKLPYSVLDNAVLRATEALRSAQTELVFSDNGILAIDKNDPNLVTLFNSAGLGVSRDGGATFENAITGEGINASVIVAGILQGINIIQESGNRSLELSNGEIFSYYQNQLAMKFGQYSMEFYNRINDRLASITPISSLTNPDLRGLGIYIDNDFLSMGFERGGAVRPVFRSSEDEARTVVAGPFVYNNGDDNSSLQLYANAYLHSSTESPTQSIDQPSIVMTQGRVDNDMLQYFGGYNRRNGAVWQVRWRSSQDESLRRLEVNSEGVLVQGEFNNTSSIEYKTNVTDYEEKALDVINELEVVNYQMKEDIKRGINKVHTGFISENSPAIASDDGKTINIFKLLSLNTKAIQELHKELEALENVRN